MKTLSRTIIAVAVGFLVSAVPAHAQRRGGGRGPGADAAIPRAAGPRALSPRIAGVAPGRFYRPYYDFRPRVSLGFGLWAGYPFAYPYSFGYYGLYAYPYRYAYPYPYPYAYPYSYSSPYVYAPYGYAYPPVYPAYPLGSSRPSGTVEVRPEPRNSGGVSFEITPRSAEVFVDGSYVGSVRDFTPTTRPLDLTPGRHRIEIRAEGYRTMVFDADVVSGEIVPYRGALQRP